MGLNLVWIFFLILYSDFTLSKDVIETDGIPSHWKRSQEIVNNPDHRKIHNIQNEKPNNKILNYGLGVQRPTKIIPSDLLSYKIMQSTKNATNRNINSISDTKLVHNNGNMEVENKNIIYDKQHNNINEHNKDVDQVLQKFPKDTEIENTSNELKNVDTFEKPAELDIVHEKDKLVMLLPQRNDTISNFLDKLCRKKGITKPKELQERKDGTSHNKEQYKNENNDEFILKSHDYTKRKPLNRDKIETDEISLSDQQNVQPHALYNPRGWIRYFRPNQYSLSNHSKNYISKLYSKTKYSNPFYGPQDRFTRHLSYGADKRYRRPDVRYQIGL